ncbi:hypothetical protein ACFWOL_30190, partial [Streptomyces sp. NPDC058442]
TAIRHPPLPETRKALPKPAQKPDQDSHGGSRLSGERDDRLTTAEREELKQLRRENAELKRANEILKAASVFFAQEIDRPRTRPSR